MKFYYGADKLVIKPLFNTGNPSNDYGLGFYLTTDKEIAKLWASKFKNGGFLIEYDVDTDGLNIKQLATINDNDILTWLSILIAHRFSIEERNQNIQNIKWLEANYPIDLTGVDVIIGYRADDSYFDYSRDFVRNDLSLELLKDAMMLGKLGKQFVLISEKAFKHIKYVKHEEVPYTDEYQVFRSATKNEYLKLKKEDDINNTYLRDIMRKRKNGN
jgi:hypothetical protein